jgi:class 3 adenylate cyclase
MAKQALDGSLEVTLAALRSRLATFLPADLAVRLEQGVSPDDGPAEWVQLLLQVIHTLNALHHDLGTYLPRPLTLSQPTPGLPRGEFLEGTVLFADVAGFTPLTERLRALGEEGAERLNRMINDLFTALLSPLSRSGGELLIFAGDAVQAYFPAMEDAQDAVWATRAGLRMARAIAPFDTGPTPLSMGVGLARGRFFAAQIGTARRMEYLVTHGPIQGAMQAEGKAAPRQVSLAPGLETLLAGQFRLAPLADAHHAVVDDLGDDLGDFELDKLATRLRTGAPPVLDHDPAALLETMATTLAHIETLAPFFPPDVLRRIVAHQRERQFPGEHRLVAVMFVNLRGFEALIEALGPQQAPQLTAWINRYFVEAQETLAGCGGLVTHVDPFARGFTLLCPFGAPLADEETPHRAAAAALRLNEKLRVLNRDLQAALAERLPDQDEQLQLTHHIGITYGPIYTGQVGWQERREYVVVGDDVNLSARLMNKAQPNQILISGWVHDRVRQAFECRPLEPMQLKGKAKPVTVYAVERRVPASAWLVEAAVGPLIGRDTELVALESALDELEGGRGRALILVGETGMGKTRLVAELARRARYWGITLLAGRCLSYSQATPYTPWLEALWRWFELNTAADRTERRARIQQGLERLGLGQLTETFCALLGLPQEKDAVPDTKFVAEARPPARLDLFALLQARIQQLPLVHRDLHLDLAWRLAERDPTLAADIPSLWEHLGQTIHPDQALLALFKAIAEQNKPVLFLVEDLQWADHASWTALVNLAQATSHNPVFLLVTVRSGEAEKRWLSICAPLLEEETDAELLALKGLDWADTGKLAARLIRAREAAPELVSWLHQRARGNPLFITQLLYALAGADGLSTDAQTGRVALSRALPSLPLSVREIMLSRVDQLPEETRTVVKLASVVGDTVPWELLTHLALEIRAVSEARLTEHLTILAQRSLLAPAPPAAEFAFVHPMLQEAVYSSVAYAQRRRWHRAIADELASGDPEKVHQHLDMLAYHYNHSDVPGLGVRYNRLAGDKARLRQAWDEAQDYYQAAIEAADQDSALAEERCLAYEHLGDVYALTGRYVQAASAYEGALVGASHPARLAGKLGLMCPLLDCVDEAVKRMEKGWDELDLDAPLRPWLAAALGWVALRARPKDMAAVAGAGAAAISWFQRGQRIARSDTVQVALKEMMAGRVPADYDRLVYLALSDSKEG